MEENNKTAEEIKLEIDELRQKIAILESTDKEFHLVSSITKQMADSVITTDLNFRINYVNTAFQKLYGYSEDELMGQSPDILNIEPNSKQIQRDIYETVSSGNIWRGETRNRRKDDSIFPCEMNVFPLKDEQGNIFAYAGTQKDITERKQAEDNLKQAKDFIDTAINAQSDTFFVFSPKTGKAIKWNDNFSRVSGYTDDEISAMRAPDSYYDQDDLEKANESLKELTSTNSVTIELSLIARKGKRIPFEYKVSLIEVSGGENIAISIGRDITEQKRAEEEQHIASEKLRLSIENMLEGYALHEAIFDQTGRMIDFQYIEFNPFAQKILNIPREQIVGKTALELFPHIAERGLMDKYANVMATGQSAIIEDFYYEGDTLNKAFDISCYRLDEKLFVCTFRDITERKQTEKALETSKHKAETANIAKSQFLANMSHEIRTPMNVITGFADLLLSENDPNEQKINVQLIHKASKSLLCLIDEILDISKIEAGRLEINMSGCSLRKLLNGIEVLMQPLATESGLHFDIFEPASLPDIITTDSDLVRQCLVNLIANAIKFTSEGHVLLKVSTEKKDDQPFIRFDVEDTGIGIPSDQHESIFESFSQVDGSHTRQYGGTGLGLAITKQLANLLGGDLFLTSEENKGSVFSLIIAAGVDIESSALSDKDEVTKVATPKYETSDNLKFTGKVLLAEDNEGCQVLTRKIVERYGLEVVVVGNGKHAVEKAQIEQFSLILMDMQMPVLNGFEATQKLRDEGTTTPIIALTAYAMQGDKDKCINAGCDDYLSKPIANEELIRILAKYASTEKEQSN